MVQQVKGATSQKRLETTVPHANGSRLNPGMVEKTLKSVSYFRLLLTLFNQSELVLHYSMCWQVFQPKQQLQIPPCPWAYHTHAP